MSDLSLVINMLADISPAGVLPLAFGMSGTGYIPSIMLLLLFGTAAAYMMFLVSRTIEIAGVKSYDRLWEKCIGRDSKWIPTVVLWLVCFGNALAYICMVGDLISMCLPGFGIHFLPRSYCIALLALFPLLPLCMLKDLSALAPTSFLALIAVLYMAIMMVIRYADGSYLPGGQYHGFPRPSGHVANFGIASLLLVNNLSIAFLCECGQECSSRRNRTLAEMEQSAAEVQRAAAQLSLCKVDWLRCYESAAGQDVLGSEALRNARDDAEVEAVKAAAVAQSTQMDWTIVASSQCAMSGPTHGTAQGAHGMLGTARSGVHEGHGMADGALHDAVRTVSPASHGEVGDAHGHGASGDFATAKHHLEHRWMEKTAFGAAERVVERMTERVGVGERLAERSAERLVERGMERGAEIALQRAGQGAARHIVGRAIGESLRMTEHATMQALKALRVLVPFVGMLFVIHLAEHDWHRFMEEWKARRSVSCSLFALALLGDAMDTLAHVCVISAGLVHIDHDFLHSTENYGMGFAVMACCSVVAGEISSAKAQRRELKRNRSKGTTVVPITGSP
ncbi:Vacuolar amino acid transporter 2 [Durusdinium trenchii]|uniref:Vacuolar amino acid transporter 2 n=1 Tax=Durusdinium trenchii TaxID=1381693 RepID=A0ABP0IM04_9DINO